MDSDRFVHLTATTYQRAKGQMSVDRVVVYGHALDKGINRKIVTFIEQVVEASEIVLGYHSKITGNLAALATPQEKSDPQRNYE